MKYSFSRILGMPHDQAVDRTKEALKKEGFGVLTEINVKEVLKKKLDVDFRPYTILGACNPPLAYKTIQAERMIGIMLPCNLVVQEAEGGKSEVAAVDPLVSMQAVANPQLADTAKEVQAKLKRVIENLKNKQEHIPISEAL